MSALGEKRPDLRHYPYEVEIEQTLLGAALIHNNLIDALSEILQPEHFYDPLHQRLFAQFCRARAESQNVTPLTVTAALKADPGLKELGGLRYLANLALNAPSLASVDEAKGLARIVVDVAARRALIAAGEAIVDEGYASPLDRPTPSLLALAQQEVERVFADWQKATGQTRASGIKEISEQVVKTAEEGRAAPQSVARVYTGLSLLDDQTGGMAPADYIVLAGRSGNGKSSLGAAIARAAAQGARMPSGGTANPVPVIFFSLEMQREQLAQRMICDAAYDSGAETPLAYSRFRSMRFEKDQIERIAVAQTALAGIPLEIDDTPGLSISQISARSRAFKARHGGALGLVVIDYLQKVQPESRDRTREQDVAGISQGLVALAKSLGWPVLALAQLLTKGSETKDTLDRPPQLRDIRESGQIEIDADMIWAVHRKSRALYQRKPDAAQNSAEYVEWETAYNACKNDLEVLGLKNRHGEEFRVKLFCEMAASAIRDPAGRGP